MAEEATDPTEYPSFYNPALTGAGVFVPGEDNNLGPATPDPAAGKLPKGIRQEDLDAAPEQRKAVKGRRSAAQINASAPAAPAPGTNPTA